MTIASIDSPMVRMRRHAASRVGGRSTEARAVASAQGSHVRVAAQVSRSSFDGQHGLRLAGLACLVLAVHAGVAWWLHASGQQTPLVQPPKPLPMTVELTRPPQPLAQAPEPPHTPQAAPAPRPAAVPPHAVHPTRAAPPKPALHAAQPLESAVAAQAQPAVSQPPTPAAAQPPVAPAAPPRETEPIGDAAYLHNPAPDYPAFAQDQGWEGHVILRVHVLASGTPDVVQLKTSSGHRLLDDAAVAAVRRWAFVPAKRGEDAVDGWVNVPIDFKLG
ncbi:energy transducer TonB [Paraburkholderia pallida]|uniref:Energy transducer TonB n=1 Tax=Paraburkholderia pallida TaxID=2547399 RepID=A0A4P7CX76_9BURK|nr:energy transducer TonB [Paraburkholderia pallida]QBQ98879.1 energy transducer TonB [Paraburkholderia pallida]